MTDEERAAFEQEMQEQPQLAEDVKIVAWTIEAIRERGQQEDSEAIRRMREGMGTDNKRYAATLAAVIGGVLVVAAMTVVSIPPLYQHVIKPIIESVFTPEEKSNNSSPLQPSSSNPSIDSLATNNSTDSVEVADESEEEEQTVVNEPQNKEDEPAKEEKVEEEPKKEEVVIEEKAKEEEKEEAKEDNPPLEPKTVNKVSNVDRREMVDNTEYHLTKIDYDNKGNLVAYMTLLNNRENLEYVFEKMLVNIDGDQRNAYRVTVNGETKNSFTLKKRQPVNIVLYFNGVRKDADHISLLQMKNRNEFKSCQMKGIPLNRQATR